MGLWWIVNPTTQRGVPANDAAAKDAAAAGWPVVAYDNQDAGLAQGFGYDPNVALGHQITADRVLVFNAMTQRYEWMSQAQVAAQQAATGQYGAETQRAATTADIIAASRGPENAFQYSNALHGQPDASGVGIFDALAGRLGAPTTAGTPAQGDLHPIDIMGRVQAILNRSFGTGGANGNGSSSWADAAGMAPTATEQRAQGAVQTAQQAHQAGQQAASDGGGGDPYAAARHGPNTATTPGTYISAPYDPGAPPTSVRHGPNTAHTPGTYISAPYDAAPVAAAYTPNPMGRADAQMVRPMTAYGPSQAVFDPFSGKVDTGAYARASGLSGSGSSDIAWKNKSHQLIEGRGYGHGSDARNAAHQAAGMTGEQFDRIVKHGGDPFKQIHAAQGMGEVITHPVTIHAGEDGKDEYHIIIPLERADQPVPRALLALANMQSPDRDHMRGAGGVYGSEMVGSNTAGDSQNPLYGVPPNQVDQFGQAGVGPNGVYPPTGRPDDTVNDQSNPIPNYRPGTYDQYQGAPFAPTYSPANDPNKGIHMAAGGGLAVIGGGTTVKPANGPANAAGQVRVPQGRGTRLVPASQTTPMPNFGALPPALLSLIAPSDWKLIGSEYGAAGGNAEDIPWLLKRGTRGLGRAPGAFAGRVF